MYIHVHTYIVHVCLYSTCIYMTTFIYQLFPYVMKRDDGSWLTLFLKPMSCYSCNKLIAFVQYFSHISKNILKMSHLVTFHVCNTTQLTIHAEQRNSIITIFVICITFECWYTAWLHSLYEKVHVLLYFDK